MCVKQAKTGRNVVTEDIFMSCNLYISTHDDWKKEGFIINIRKGKKKKNKNI